jgi:hypothetical protein
MEMRQTLQNRTVPYVQTRITRRNNGNGGNMVQTSMKQLLTDTSLMGFMQATTHPFGPEGVGAVIPDAYDDSCISTYDPHSASVDLKGLFDDTSITQFDGFICLLIPRCIASGIFSGTPDYNEDSPSDEFWSGRTIFGLSFQFVDSDFKPLFTIGGASVNDDPTKYVFGDPYFLMLLPIDVNGHSIIQTFQSAATTPYQTVRGAYIMRMPRCQNINSNTEAFRIAGAGIKLNPRVAPINTSGVCFAGQVRIATMIKLLNLDLITASTGTFKNFQQNLIGHYVNVKGIRGGTSRLNVFQNEDQMVKQQTSIAAAFTNVTFNRIDLLSTGKPIVNRGVGMYKGKKRKVDKVISRPFEEVKSMDGDDSFYIRVKDKYNKTTINQNTSSDEFKLGAVEDKYLEMRGQEYLGIAPSKNDLIDPGDMVPVCYYQFNESEPLLLQLRAVVHGVAEPIPTLPFLGRPVRRDPLFSQAKALVPNPDIFPLCAVGNSFKSVMSKFNNIFGTVMRGASRVHKFTKLVEDKF